jgi:hypothetical protein
MNQVIDPNKMEEKWQREVKYISLMSEHYPEHVPEILDIDQKERKIYLKVDGNDFWERANCMTNNYDIVLPNWQEQMIEIVKAHKSLGLYKYSLHPSSYFIVNEKLKSINYFFTYHEDEPNFSFKDVESHIYVTRQNELKKHMSKFGVVYEEPQPFETFMKLAWTSFKTNYPDEFINNVIGI